MNGIDKYCIIFIHERMNWSDYPIFLAIAETGSLTAAGKTLSMSQPTVGRRIRALEAHFGTPLLTKEDGILVPTAFGHSMLDHIRRMQDEAAAINRSSATLEHSLAGPVRIAATEGLGTLWVPGVMQSFRESHPDLLLDLTIGFEASNLAQREADIALRWMGPGNQNSLIARKVADVAFGVHGSKDYMARRPEIPVTKQDLVTHDAVILQLNADNYLWPKTEAGEHYPHGRLTFRSNNMQAHQTAIINGYGLGILPLCFVTDDMNLQRILPEQTHHEDLWIVAHEDLTKSTRVRAVFDFLMDAISKDRKHFYLGEASIFGAGSPFICGGARADSPDHAHVLEPRKQQAAE